MEMEKQMKQIRLISTSVEHTEIGLAQAHMRCAGRRSARARMRALRVRAMRTLALWALCKPCPGYLTLRYT